MIQYPQTLKNNIYHFWTVFTNIYYCCLKTTSTIIVTTSGILVWKQTGITTIFSFGYQFCTWPRSGPFCWQNPCPGYNSGIDLIFILKYTFFQSGHILLFLQLFLPMIVHVGNLYLFSTTAAQMLLTPRWVSRQKIRNSYHTYISKLKFGVLSISSAVERFLPIPI